ncbi:hypothetical protein B0O99DRAFT_233935 [Bisporella sp. PMI_857]|nr:hypothetical protein B0O99DRAFT_233935 [Bisporella sp. PMI_857]
MPMLYGEGKRAFIRLQEEIVKITDDQSIFAWSPQDEHGLDGLVEHVLNRLVGDVTHGLFALSPFAFANCSDIVRSTSSTKTTFQMTNRGVHTQLHIINSNDFTAMDEEKLVETGSRREPLNLSHPDTKHCAVLNCERIGNSGSNLAVVCRRVNKDRTFDQTKPQLFQRYTPLEPLQVTKDIITRCQRTEPVYILKHGTKPDLLHSARKYQKYSIETSELGSYGFPLAYYPTDCIKIDADYKLVIDKAKLMGGPVSPTDRYGAVKYAFPDGVNFALVIRKSGHDLMFNVIGPLDKTETLEQICLSYFPNTPVEQVTCRREWVNSVERAVLRHEAGKQSIHLAIKRRIVTGQRRTIVSLDCITHEPNDTEMDNID